ncbi:metallophosphoesterase family protein [Pararoseomonas indoligenes]|uniref:Metallophosphoesterase n=1 Tax=Roseomonas indoligenes TaxID=2820811 RepID=A0A940MSS5_9PROT|nr:metallophosphoesterase [Pararoseomonas indoligenes]MBP0491226.1 metallophosphoesterase [Pararoseomonas indoligenes]
MRAPMLFTLAHLSDLHLPVPSGAIRPLGQLAGKRLLAYLAWRRKRRRAVPAGALLEDVAAAAPDHVAVTGDLTNLALPGEFAAARELLAALGPPEGVTVVPGNHDATAAVPWVSGIGQWAPWMTGEAGEAPFPFLRRRGPVALIGLSSAVPTLPGSAAGRLGPAQLAALPALLDAAGGMELFRIVLIHHPPLPGPGGRRKALADGPALRGVLARHGAELVLHGHHHRPMQGAIPGPVGPIPVLGPPQALAAGNGGPPGWQILRIGRDGDGWRVEVELRVQDVANGPFRTAPPAVLRVSSAGGSSSSIPLAVR